MRSSVTVTISLARALLVTTAVTTPCAVTLAVDQAAELKFILPRRLMETNQSLRAAVRALAELAGDLRGYTGSTNQLRTSPESAQLVRQLESRLPAYRAKVERSLSTIERWVNERTRRLETEIKTAKRLGFGRYTVAPSDYESARPMLRAERVRRLADLLLGELDSRERRKSEDELNRKRARLHKLTRLSHDLSVAWVRIDSFFVRMQRGVSTACLIAEQRPEYVSAELLDQAMRPLPQTPANLADTLDRVQKNMLNFARLRVEALEQASGAPMLVLPEVSSNSDFSVNRQFTDSVLNSTKP